MKSEDSRLNVAVRYICGIAFRNFPIAAEGEPWLQSSIEQMVEQESDGLYSFPVEGSDLPLVQTPAVFSFLRISRRRLNSRVVLRQTSIISTDSYEKGLIYSRVDTIESTEIIDQGVT